MGFWGVFFGVLFGLGAAGGAAYGFYVLACEIDKNKRRVQNQYLLPPTEKHDQPILCGYHKGETQCLCHEPDEPYRLATVANFMGNLLSTERNFYGLQHMLKDVIGFQLAERTHLRLDCCSVEYPLVGVYGDYWIVALPLGDPLTKISQYANGLAISRRHCSKAPSHGLPAGTYKLKNDMSGDHYRVGLSFDGPYFPNDVWFLDTLAVYVDVSQTVQLLSKFVDLSPNKLQIWKSHRAAIPEDALLAKYVPGLTLTSGYHEFLDLRHGQLKLLRHGSYVFDKTRLAKCSQDLIRSVKSCLPKHDGLVYEVGQCAACYPVVLPDRYVNISVEGSTYFINTGRNSVERVHSDHVSSMPTEKFNTLQQRGSYCCMPGHTELCINFSVYEPHETYTVYKNNELTHAFTDDCGTRWHTLDHIKLRSMGKPKVTSWHIYPIDLSDNETQPCEICDSPAKHIGVTHDLVPVPQYSLEIENFLHTLPATDRNTINQGRTIRENKGATFYPSVALYASKLNHKGTTRYIVKKLRCYHPTTYCAVAKAKLKGLKPANICVDKKLVEIFRLGDVYIKDTESIEVIFKPYCWIKNLQTLEVLPQCGTLDCVEETLKTSFPDSSLPFPALQQFVRSKEIEVTSTFVGGVIVKWQGMFIKLSVMPKGDVDIVPFGSHLCNSNFVGPIVEPSKSQQMLKFRKFVLPRNATIYEIFDIENYHTFLYDRCWMTHCFAHRHGAEENPYKPRAKVVYTTRAGACFLDCLDELGKLDLTAEDFLNYIVAAGIRTEDEVQTHWYTSVEIASYLTFKGYGFIADGHHGSIDISRDDISPVTMPTIIIANEPSQLHWCNPLFVPTGSAPKDLMSKRLLSSNTTPLEQNIILRNEANHDPPHSPTLTGITVSSVLEEVDTSDDETGVAKKTVYSRQSQIRFVSRDTAKLITEARKQRREARELATKGTDVADYSVPHVPQFEYVPFEQLPHMYRFVENSVLHDNGTPYVTSSERDFILGLMGPLEYYVHQFPGDPDGMILLPVCLKYPGITDTMAFYNRLRKSSSKWKLKWIAGMLAVQAEDNRDS